MTQGADHYPDSADVPGELVVFEWEVVERESLTREQLAAMEPQPGEARPVPADYADALLAAQSLASCTHF